MTFRTRDPKRAMQAFRDGKLVLLSVHPAQLADFERTLAEVLHGEACKRFRVRSDEALERAGCVLLRTTRSGRTVGLYRSVEAGIETDPDHRWSTVCEVHGGVVCHATRRNAELSLSHPEEWCPDCQDEP